MSFKIKELLTLLDEEYKFDLQEDLGLIRLFRFGSDDIISGYW